MLAIATVETAPAEDVTLTINPDPFPPVVLTPLAVTYPVPPAVKVVVNAAPTPAVASTVNPVPDPPVVAAPAVVT